MALFARMRPRKGQLSTQDRFAQLETKILGLEDRLRLLESRLRALTAQGRRADEQALAKKAPRAARARPRPRCPGCTLELPKGRRGDFCVWCGFMFSAVGGRALR
jgi:hypothetical protein